MRKNVSTSRQGQQTRIASPAAMGPRSLYHLIFELSSTLSYPRVLELALDLATGIIQPPASSGEDVISAILLFPEGESKEAGLQVALARRFAPPDLQASLPVSSGLVRRVMDEGSPQLANDPGNDPELSRFKALQHCTVIYCLPLGTELDLYGVMLFAHPDPDFFTEERREVLEIAASQTAIAIQNARRYQTLELEKERLMEIQEETRKKIARDLHDGPTQSISAIAMRVNFGRRLIDRDIQAAAGELYHLEELARRTTKEIRYMLFTLRPMVLESYGLVAALQSLAEKVHETYNENVILQVETRSVTQLEARVQREIFSIVEEAVTNARKHAKAAHIWMRLKDLQEDGLLLEVEDDGVGFPIEAINAAPESLDRLGIKSMRLRAALVNSSLHLESTEGRGTLVQVRIPLVEATLNRLRRER